MKRLFFVILTGCGLLIFGSGGAAAGQVWLDYDGTDPAGHSATFTFPTIGEENVYVGEYLVAFSEFESAVADTHVFCIEDGQESEDQPHQFTLFDLSDFSDRKYKEAAYIFKEYGSHYNPGVSDERKKNSQVAIWEVFLDPENYDVTGGLFYADSGWEGAQEIIDDAEAVNFDDYDDLGNPYDFTGVAFAFSDTRQDYIIPVASPGEEVPVPAAVWLLGSGLLGLAGLRKRLIP